jgi:hypothetical protein
MIGQPIESRQPFPLGSLLLAVGGLGLVVLSLVFWITPPALLSVPLWVLAGVLLLSWRGRFVLELTETTLEVRSSGLSIPFQDIESLTASGRPANPFQKGRPHYPIEVGYPNGVLHIPSRLNVPSDQVYLFLFQHLAREEAQKGVREVHSLVQAYFKYQERRHGRERVHVYRARERTYPRSNTGLWLATNTLLGTGLIWLLLVILFHDKQWDLPVWGVLGGFLIFIGAVLAIGALTSQFSRKTKLHGACIVLCPDGLALVQGQLQGQLRWPELKKVKLQRARHFTWTNHPVGPGVLLQVEGASMLIADVYDRPAAVIYQQLCFYWRGEQGNESFMRDAREAEAAQHRRAPSDGITAE